jgi:hypothetical protein
LSGGFCMEPPSSRPEEPPSWEDLYKINLMPSELFLKFRKELQGLRVGVNLELYNEPTNDYHAKLVLKPLCPERKWKFIYEPLHQEVRVLSKKIPVTRFLNLQVFLLYAFLCLFVEGGNTCVVILSYAGWCWT